MKVLLGFECSGIVREEFKKRGHDAWSCDLKPSEIPGQHIQDDIFNVIGGGWDLLIAHPPCTYLCVTANKWLKDQPPRKSGKLVGAARREAQKNAVDLFMKIAKAPIKKKALENPVGIMSTLYRQPDQIIQPYYFGDEASKATCLWLYGLPKLFHAKQTDLFCGEITHVDRGERIIMKSGKSLPKWFSGPATESRQDDRSRTFPGIAKAMAEQWG